MLPLTRPDTCCAVHGAGGGVNSTENEATQAVRMSIACEEVLRELSNYIDEDVGPELREAIQQHLSWCRNCTITLDGTRNVLRLICDQRAFELPDGLSRRLYNRLQRHVAAQVR